MDLVILVAALWVSFEAVLAMRQGRDPNAAPDGTLESERA